MTSETELDPPRPQQELKPLLRDAFGEKETIIAALLVVQHHLRKARAVIDERFGTNTVNETATAIATNIETAMDHVTATAGDVVLNYLFAIDTEEKRQKH